MPIPFTIIIATCGRPERLAAVLERMAEAVQVSGADHRVIVVDNGLTHSAAEPVAALAAKMPFPLRYLTSTPLNKCRALNVGIAAAETEWLAFTDDDTLPDSRWLLEAGAFAEREHCRVFGALVVPEQTGCALPAWLVPGRSGRIPLLSGAMVRYAPLPASGILGKHDPIPLGANVFVRRDVFKDHGGYNDVLWTVCGKAALGVDDGEFGVRLLREGEPIGYCREAVVVHPVYPARCTLWSHVKSAFYYGWRDPLVFFDVTRPLIELFRLRQAVVSAGYAVGNAWCRDYGAAAADLLDAVKVVGTVTCRWSSSYRRWARLNAGNQGITMTP